MTQALLQQALDVLRGCLDHPDAADVIAAIESAIAQPAAAHEIDTLRAAIAQSLQPAVSDALPEPVRAIVEHIVGPEKAGAVFEAISDALPIYEDVYEQCCELIKPDVDAGRLPGSVVESLTLLIAASRALPAPVPEPVAYGVRFANTGKWNNVFVVGVDDADIADHNQDHLVPLYTQGAPAQAAGVTLPPMDEHLDYILGTMCFQCISHAQMLRASGQIIATKAEAEQAAVLYWMLGFYFKHGADWRKEAAAEVKRLHAAFVASPATTPTEGSSS